VNSSNTISAVTRIAAIMLASLAPSISAAQAGAPQSPQTRLTLARALALADAHYPQVRVALEQQIGAKEEIGVARTAYLPRADMLWQTNRAAANNAYGLLLPQGIIPSISGPVLPSDNTRSAWSSAGGTLLSWQPLDFGLRRAQVNAAREGANAATAGLNLTRLDVEFAAANAYFDLATAKQLVVTAQANVQRLQVFASAVHVLVDNQLRPGADAAQADAQLAVARTQFVQAQTNAQVRAAVLSDFLGIPSSAIDLDDSQLAESAPADLPDAAAITSHPQARQEAALVNQQREELSALARSYAPQFNTQAALSGRGAGTSLSGAFPGGTSGLAPDTFNWAVGIQVGFPAFDIFSIHERKKVQQANVRAEQAHYDQTVDDLSAQEQQAEAQLAGSRQLAQNTPIELAAARESEVQQRARFQSGLATVVDVAAAESLLVQAETDDAVARLNTWRSLAAVAAARGDLAPFLAQLAK